MNSQDRIRQAEEADEGMTRQAAEAHEELIRQAAEADEELIRQAAEAHEELILQAAEAMQHAYAPYSHYWVGAALQTKDGRIYTGCNIENATYGATNCAERTAFFKAVSEGERNFSRIAIVGGPEGEWTEFAAPCGICRQVMGEFCDGTFEILLATKEGARKTYSLDQLLPERFTLNKEE